MTTGVRSLDNTFCELYSLDMIILRDHLIGTAPLCEWKIPEVKRVTNIKGPVSKASEGNDPAVPTTVAATKILDRCISYIA